MDRPDTSVTRKGFDGADSSRGVEKRLVSAAWAQFEQLTAGAKNTVAGPQPHFSVPGYQILREIHRGGQGIVYQAIHESTHRKLAIKVLKEGPFADRTGLARFEREIDVLSQLDHPHIVAIHDRGLTNGHAYYVMDYIAGKSLDAYVAGADLDVEAILKLFVMVCEAVNVAHLRGVIHRDLKPGNIRIDLEGVPRILDFGLAKLEQEVAGDSSATGMTLAGQFVGSLPWASPEQAEGRSEQLDIRTDVYSLGVILYQLLTARFPYPVTGRVGDVVHHITQSSPARLSTMQRAIDRDLEIVVLKCLAKEPEGRYQSAGELARDVKRFLANEPVDATSPSAGYRFRKFIRRNRGLVTAVTVIAVTLVVATTVSVVFAMRASRALDLAKEQRALAEQNAEETRQVARYQSSLLAGIDVQAVGAGFKKLYREQVHDNLSRQFVGDWPARRKLTDDEINAAMANYDRTSGPVQPVDVARRVLDEYVLGNDVETVKSQFADQPRVQAELLETIGVMSRKLGLFDKAVPPLRIALSLRQADPAVDAVALANSMSELAGATAGTGDFKEAEQLHSAALALYREHLGDRHPETIRSMDMVAVNRFECADQDGAEALFVEALTLARGLSPAEPGLLARILTSYGGALQVKGEFKEAEALTREALELRRNLLGEESKEYADTLNNLAGILYEQRDYDACARLLDRCIEIQRKVSGEESVPVATLINNLGGVLRRKGDRAAAKVHYAEALGMYRKLLGDEHPEVVSTLNNLAMMHQMDGDLSTSGPMLREALELRRRIRSPDHPEVALSTSNLALQLEKEGDVVQAESLYRQAVAIDSQKLTPCHSWRVSAEIGLLRTLRMQNKLDEMETLLNEFYDAAKAAEPDEPCRVDYVKSYVRLYAEKDKLAPGQGFDAKAAEWRATTQPSR